MQKRQRREKWRTFAGAMVGLLAIAPLAFPVRACPFCTSMGKTMLQELADADAVLHVRLSNARPALDANIGQSDGTTDMEVLAVIKPHPTIKENQKSTIPRYVPSDDEGTEYLLFAEIVDGDIDPYRGIPLENRELVNYLAGAAKLREAKPAERLGYFFKFLDHGDVTIANDAYNEFANAPYADVASAASAYDADKLLSWVRDKRTAEFRIGLYGCLIGLAGRPEDAKTLRGILDDERQRPITGVDGVMGGYCVLDPVEGPRYVLGVIGDPNNDFNYRYAALRTVRFLVTEMPKIDRDWIFAELAKAMDAPDISDLVIEEFRKNKVWAPVDKVLAVYSDERFNMPIVRRAVIRFALKCPDQKTKDFIAALRQSDPKLLDDVEELLRFEEAQQIQIGGR